MPETRSILGWALDETLGFAYFTATWKKGAALGSQKYGAGRTLPEWPVSGCVFSYNTGSRHPARFLNVIGYISVTMVQFNNISPLATQFNSQLPRYLNCDN